MAAQPVMADVSCAVEVFVATALLHREQPGRADFTIQEIVNRAARENMTGELRSGVNVHASLHCVANKRPNPAKNKMLFATGKHTRRLLLPGDEVDSGRTGKIFPDADEVPSRYLGLLEWAKARYYGQGGTPTGETSGGTCGESNTGNALRWLESLFELEGLGREHWKGVDPDEYVRKLREGWD